MPRTPLLALCFVMLSVSETNAATPADRVAEGKVLAVAKLGPHRFVQLDRGKKHGLKPGMKMLIHRGDDFVGTVFIAQVEDESSAGALHIEPGAVANVGDVFFGGLRTDVSLQEKVSTLEKKLRKSEARVVAAEDRNDTLRAAINRQAKILAFAQQQMKGEKGAEQQARRQLVDSAHKHESMVAQIELLTRQVRYLKEALADANKDLVRYERAIAGTDPVLRLADPVRTQAQPHDDVELTGKVTAVEHVGEQYFVQLDRGSKQGVKKNLRAIVHRGDKRIGVVLVTFVDDNACAGILDLKPNMKVKAGDAFYTGKRVAKALGPPKSEDAKEKKTNKAGGGEGNDSPEKGKP